MQVYLNTIHPYNIGFQGNSPEDHGIKIKTFGRVSPLFEWEMQEGLKEFPAVILKKLKQANLLDEIRFAPKASESVPDIPDLHEEYQTIIPSIGHSPDYFAGGIADEGINQAGETIRFIGVFENPLSLDAAPGNKWTLGHELSHKVSELSKNDLGMDFSETEEFKEVVRKDLAKLPERIKENPEIVRQFDGSENITEMIFNSTPENLVPEGLEEIFANCGASITTGIHTNRSNNIKIMEALFPESQAYVKKLFYSLGMRG